MLKWKSTITCTCFTFFLLLLTLPAGCANFSQSELPPPGREQVVPLTLTVSAAASLTDALEEIKGLYQTRTGHILVMNYGSSGALQQQIEQGAPVDLFIAAAQRQMETLQGKGLILAESRVELLGNEVVLIVPAVGKDGEIKDFNSLTADSLKLLAIGEPESVPAGRYAKEVLSSLGIWEMVEPKLILAKDVRQVLTYVETGNVDAGIVYLTEALTSEKVTVISTAPAGSHSPVTYPAAIMAAANAQQAAEDFMAFLQGNTAKEIFEQHGFTFIAGKQD